MYEYVVMVAVSEFADVIVNPTPGVIELIYQGPMNAEVFIISMSEFDVTYASVTTSVVPVVNHVLVFNTFCEKGGRLDCGD